VVPATIIHAEGTERKQNYSKLQEQEMLKEAYQRFMAKWMPFLSQFKGAE